MDTDQLQTFRVVARCGSLSAAARELGVSQPAVSGTIQSLERRFNAQLLMRTSRGAQLTEAGQLVLELAETLARELAAADELIAQLADGEAGRFVVGCHASLGSYFLPTFLPDLIVRYPHLEVSVRNASSSEVLSLVRSREIDFGLVVNPEPFDELVIAPLFHDRVTFFAREASSDEAHALETIGARAMCYMERMPQAQQLLAQLESRGVQPARRLPCGEHELVRALSQSGAHCAVLPYRVATMQPAPLKLLHPALPSASDWIALCWRADRPRTRGSTCLKNAIVTAGRAMAEVAPVTA